MERLSQPKKSGGRTCGVKPGCPDERASRVAAAVRTLEKIGAAFTVADVAERAGLSRSTIYRSAELRALVGSKGDGPRTVDADVHAKLANRHETAKAKARDLRRQLADSEQSWEEMRERALLAERRLLEAQRRIQVLEAQGAAAAAGLTPLASVAARLGPDGVRRARRTLARALHPDLFGKDPAAAALATEILKSVNALAD